MEKNEIFHGSCSALGANGEGIVKIDGFTVFVENILPGEEADILLVKAKKSYGYGKIMNITKKSLERRTPPCPYYKTCGGCSLQHMSYETQLELKRDKVADCLERIGGIKGIELPPTIGMENPWNYRNKAQYPVGKDKGGKAVMGFYSPRSHRITDIDSCMLQSENTSEIIGIIKGFIDEYKISVYDETAHKGLIRHVLTRTGFSTGEIMVTIVINGKKIPHSDVLVERLKMVRGVVSVIMNINSRQTNVIMGEKCVTLWGKDTIRDRIGDTEFDISAFSFYQVNPVQTEKLYSLAVNFAGLSGAESVIDVYCGIGTIALFAARKAKKVYGIEIVEEAVNDARHNAMLNKIKNAEFEAGKAEHILPRLRNENFQADVIFLDPPRKGLEQSVIDAVCGIEPQKVVYVSCDPATLARDIKIFVQKGYSLKKAQTVDMFCETGHVETVVLMAKGDKDEI